MADFDSRHRVFKAMSKRIGSHKLLCDFWKFFEIEIVQDEATGKRAIHEDSHKMLCRVVSMTELAGVTDDNVIAWMSQNPVAIYNWVSYEADREGVSVQKWFVERALADEFEELIRCGMADTAVPIVKARTEIGLCIADEFLYAYQREAQWNGIYNDN